MTHDTLKTTGPRWKKWLFVASLALNLMVIGAVLAMSVGHHRGEKRHGMKMRHSFILPRGFLKQLPEQRREELKAEFGQRMYGKDRKQRWQKFRTYMQELATAIAADDYDQTKVDQLFAQLQELSTQRMSRSIFAGQALVAKLTPQERKIYAETILKRNKKWQRHERKKHDDD